MSEYRTLSARVNLTNLTKKRLKELASPSDNVCFHKERRSKKDGFEIQRDIVNVDTSEPILPLFNHLSSKDTLDSETWESCLYSKLDENRRLICIKPAENVFIAVKIMPMTLSEYEFFNDNDAKLFKHKIWKEVNILELCTVLTMAPEGIPNLPVLYSWNVCKNHDVRKYVNKNIIRAVEARQDTDEYGRRLLILYNELADEDLHTWLLKKLKNQAPDLKKQLDNVIFGIMAGLVALETNIGLVHFDLHSENVLIINDLKYDKNEYYKYTITVKGRKHSFYVPNIGTMAYVWDFSLSGLRGETDGFFIRNIIKYGKRLIDRALFTEKTEILAKNIVDNGYAQYLYSYDTFRLVQGLYRIIDDFAEKSSRTEGDNDVWNEDLEDILDDLYEIREDARDDLTKRLLRVSRGPVKHIGRPLDILLNKFKKWKKLPKNGHVIKEFKIDYLLTI